MDSNIMITFLWFESVSEFLLLSKMVLNSLLPSFECQSLASSIAISISPAGVPEFCQLCLGSLVMGMHMIWMLWQFSDWVWKLLNNKRMKLDSEYFSRNIYYNASMYFNTKICPNSQDSSSFLVKLYTIHLFFYFDSNVFGSSTIWFECLWEISDLIWTCRIIVTYMYTTK